MMDFVEVAEWKKFQHYHGRTAPWVKLHYALLDDPRFLALDEVQQCRYMKLLMVAIRCGNRIQSDPIYLAKILRVSGEVDVTPLIDSGLLLACRKRCASQRLAASYQKSTLDKTRLGQKRADETDRVDETPPASTQWVNSFTAFWASYPLQIGHGDVEAWFRQHQPDDAQLEVMLAKLVELKASKSWQEEGGKFIPAPIKWLRRKGWFDQPVVIGISKKRRIILT